MTRRKKTVSESAAQISQVMMPANANHYGSVHGGTILKLVDEAAFVAASRHARQNVVAASMDHMEFRHPVHMGDLLTLTASIFNVGRTSMDVEVEIISENIKTGKTLLIGSAYLTMVALDAKGRPTPVPGLLLKNKEELEKNKKLIYIREKRLSDFKEVLKE
ncbi:MAG: acyl-CoA thioesterase, partial [Elusimicrobia bacterium]|nr:acyl-CoA thioesterase [Elusimicrobiota bacterium]